MVRKKAKKLLGILFASSLAVGLMALAGCDDQSCEGEDCTSSHIDTSGDDGTPLPSPACEKVCGHVFEECADTNRIADGQPINDEQCVLFCDSLSDDERGCLANVPCANLGICFDNPEDPPYEPYE